MPTRYHLWVSGCQMNDSDARWLADVLDRAGMAPTDRSEDADVTVLYTCSVRQSAEDRAHGHLGHLKSLKARRPGMVLCLTGCMAGADSAELRRRYPFVDLFVAPTELEGLPELILSAAGNARLQAAAAPLKGAPRADVAAPFMGAPRGREARGYGIDGPTPEAAPSCAPAPESYGARVPVSVGVTAIRGCDKYCTFCIVPFRRGRQRSRTEAEVVAEARGLVSRGAREIVLLGQTVDAWGRDLDPPRTLASLLGSLADLPGLARLRFLTSHPSDFTPDLIRALAELPPLCEELNLPIQAGDDEVLRRMARRYAVRQYLDLVAEIRAAVPAIALSTDVIVGFPGETAGQFENTMELLRRVEFDIVHVAAYSPRPGTAAARKLVDDVPAEEKKRRLHAVEELQTAIATRKNSGFLGKTVEVLVEKREKGKWSGRTRSNKLVFFESDRDLEGELVQVAVEGAGPWSLRGALAGGERNRTGCAGWTG